MSKAYQTRDIEALQRYNAMDCIATARVYQGLLEDFKEGGPRVQKLYDQHIKLATICSEMYQNGFLVDEGNRQWMLHCLRQQRREAANKVKKLVGIKGFEATPNQMRAIIFKRHELAGMRRFGLEDPYDKRMWTKGGSIAVNQDALLLLMTQYYVPEELKVIIDAYWDVAGAAKTIGTFINSKKLLQSIGPDGRLRSSWNSCGTDTGRFSSASPNFQNIPGDCRYMYCARPGYVLVNADFSQLELRVMAAVSGDKQLEINLATGDVYTADAKMIFGLPDHLTKKTMLKAHRQQGKTGHLSWQYAATWGTMYAKFLAEDRGMKVQKAQFIKAQLDKIYAGTVEYWHREHAAVLAQGYSGTRIMDRRRYYPAEPPITETVNYPIQGTAADVMNAGTIQLWETAKRCMPDAYVLAQVHDAITYEVPEQKAQQMSRMMQEELGGIEFTIEGRKWSFPTEIKIGKFWNEV